MPPPKLGISASRASLGSVDIRQGITTNKGTNKKPLVPLKPAFQPIEKLNRTKSIDSNGCLSPESSHNSNDETIKSPDSLSSLAPRTASSQKSTLVSRIQELPSGPDQKSTSSMAQRSNGANLSEICSVEHLKTKIRVMEKKAIENRDKLKTLDKVQEEKDRYEAIIQKMQNKYQPQQQEILALRKQVKEVEEKLELMENNQVEHDLALEMATIDREMAEENADVLRNELDALKLKNEELELEIEVLAQENAELGTEMSPEEKNSHSWLQMERNNERMREALIRLRDMTQQTETELRDEIKSLREDLRDFSATKEKFELTKEKLTLSNAAIEELKQQLDNAMGAEDMIEELTEKNISLQEELEELKSTIADFEVLKEISDEVEINHVEIEKEMQSEIDSKETIILEQSRKAIKQEEIILDMEYTLLRFRELVSNLQSDLDDMRASHAMTEAESDQIQSRSLAILELNRKLQISAAKTQNKTIDLELRRLEAQEASDHLAIVKLYLPDTFNTDRDSILVLLRFKRVGFKAHLLFGFVKEKITNQNFNGSENNIFEACDVLDKLSWLAAMCDRFTNAISRCTINEFVRYESAWYELEPVERALNSWIDGIRKDELKETLCASELQRTIALMSHLAEVHIPGNFDSYADKVYMKSIIMQNQLENTAIAMGFTKQMVQTIVPNEEDGDHLAQSFSQRSEIVISQTRNAKVIVGKIVRTLEDLKSRLLSLTPVTLESFENCERAIDELARYSRNIGNDLYELLHEESRSEKYTYHEVQTISQRTTSTVFGQNESDWFLIYSNKLRILASLLSDLFNLTSNLEMTQEFEKPQPPWALRSKELKEAKAAPINAEDEIRRLKDENHERARLIAIRDQTVEESSIKIELLESRMKDATRKNHQIIELENRINKFEESETKIQKMLDKRNQDYILLEAECEELRKAVEDVKALGVITSGSQNGREQAVATAREIEMLNIEIKNLQSAIRYLRRDNSDQSQIYSQNMNWLEDPLVKPPSQKERRRASILFEGRQVLSDLLYLSKNAKIYDLTTADQNKFTWRPAKASPQYHVAKQRENFELWKSLKNDIMRRAKMIEMRNPRKVTDERLMVPGETAAQVRLNLPEWESKIVGPKEVVILEPNGFETLKGTLGIV